MDEHLFGQNQLESIGALVLVFSWLLPRWPSFGMLLTPSLIN